MKIVKKFFKILLLLFGGFTTLLFLWIRLTHIEWGHHFAFENELGIQIDSLEINVGGETKMIQSDLDGEVFGNINVPENYEVQIVSIIIFSPDSIFTIKAEDFNCYNCDGNHMYILRDTGAVYKFFP